MVRLASSTRSSWKDEQTMSVNKIMRSVMEKKSQAGTNVLGENRPVGSLQRSLNATRRYRQAMQESTEVQEPEELDVQEPEEQDVQEPEEQDEAEGLDEMDEKKSTAAERAKNRRMAKKRKGKRKDPKRQKAARTARKKHKAAFAKGAKLSAKIRQADEMVDAAEDEDFFAGPALEESDDMDLEERKTKKMTGAQKRRRKMLRKLRKNKRKDPKRVRSAALASKRMGPSARKAAARLGAKLRDHMEVVEAMEEAIDALEEEFFYVVDSYGNDVTEALFDTLTEDGPEGVIEAMEDTLDPLIAEQSDEEDDEDMCDCGDPDCEGDCE